MPQVELSPSAIKILSDMKDREGFDSLSDSVTTLFNAKVLQAVVIEKQDKEIDGLKKENERLHGIMATAGIV